MATYSFSTITAAQALVFGTSDTLVLDQGSGFNSSVLFMPASGSAPDEVSLNTGGATTVIFDAAGIVGGAKTFVDGSSLYIGTSGNDGPITLGATNDGMFGGAGADTLSGGAGSNVLQGNQGNDVLSGGAGSDTIYGGADNDQIDVGSSGTGGFANFAQGNKGDDTISGSHIDNDTLLGGQGDDLIGATGFTFDSSTFTLHISGQSSGGVDYLDGNIGNDTVVGGGTGGVMYGEDGNDFLYDSGVGKTLDGGAGNDTIVANLGGDTLTGGAGNDIIDSASLTGPDSNAGAIMDGGDGDDNINGGGGNDSEIGGAGNDTLDGGAGVDTLSGGSGADLFEISDGGTTQGVSKLDVVLDWSSQDKLFFGSGDAVGSGVATASTYTEISAADYGSALTAAGAQIHGGIINYVAVQVAADVIVFADDNLNNTAGNGVLLVGKTLADIDFGNITNIQG